jgi:hypothetical protein
LHETGAAALAAAPFQPDRKIMDCPTVKIESPVSDDNQLGFVVINATDFVDGEHVLFTDADAAAAGALSDGLKVAEIKAALTEKGIAIPDGAKKSDLQALLDASE